MQKITDNNVIHTLNRLHKEANSQGLTLIKGLLKGVFRKLKPEDMEDAYIPISRDQGAFLFDLLVSRKAKNIIEFGTSFGVSTLYLAAAARRTEGQVITTELLPSKCRIAEHNFREAGVADIVELREGNALETLQDAPDGIDFLLLDGWNDLYLPLIELLEDKFTEGALIYTDNASFKSAKPLINYFRHHTDKYRTARLKSHKGGAELTEFVGGVAEFGLR